MKKFDNVRVGDVLTRMLAGTIPMGVIVGKVDEQFVYVGSADGMVSVEEGWKFRKDNGAEVDEDLGWDGVEVTGSYLK